MKREGRQHGMVRTCMVLPPPWNPRPDSRFNKFDSPPTAGFFARVQQKPSNHSKFTGKCGKPRCNRCHVHPCCKSRDKTKGSQKQRSHDVLSNYRLTTWPVVAGRLGLSFNGASATEILDHLASIYRMDDDEGDDDDNAGYEDEVDDGYGYDEGYGDLIANYGSSSGGEVAPSPEIEEVAAADDDDKHDGGHKDDDDLDFCDVGFVLDQVEGDEGWCLVAEIM